MAIDNKNRYEVVIGLEIHIELATQSKMFCQCAAAYFGKEPNTNTCPVCLGLPGALPVANKKAIEDTIMIAKALNCQINNRFHFDRKHYSYPDLPKGYQISQYDEPISHHGYYQPLTANKGFRITRVHLEEDTGKLIHWQGKTAIDFNRSGVPLVEIVTEADFTNADEVKSFVEELQMIVRYLGVSQADMERGSMRLEPNISIRDKTKLKKGELPPYKVEVKNINSFRFAKKAIEYEIKRQVNLFNEGKIPRQETRGYDEKGERTFTQRIKENTDDYRYMPDPDIPYFQLSDQYLDLIYKKIPPLPQEVFKKLIKEGVKRKAALIMIKNRPMVNLFYSILSALSHNDRKFITNQSLANLIINKKIDQKLPIKSFIKKAIKLLKPKKTDKTVLIKTINKIVEQNTKALSDYKKGKKNVFMFLVGAVIKEMKGQVAPTEVIKELKKRLD